MKKLLVFVVFIFVNLVSISQIMWNWQYPYPQGNWLNDVHTFNKDSMIAVGRLGTILKTTNSGANWIVQNRVLDITANFKVVYFINKNTGWISSESNEVLKTTNAGSSWQAVDLGVTIASFFFFDPMNGFAGGGESFFKTTDGGDIWQLIPTEDLFIVNDIAAIDENNIWIAGFRDNPGPTPENGRVLRTINGGVNWVSGNPPDIIAASQYNCIQFVDNLTGFAAGGSFSSPVMFRTTDGGTSWNAVAMDTNETIRYMHFTNGQTGWISSLNGIFKTTNSGVNWLAQYSPKGTGSPAFSSGFNISFSPSSQECFATQYVNIIRTTNSGSNWIKLSDYSNRNSEMGKIRILDNGTGWVKEGGRLKRSTNSGLNWLDISTGAVTDVRDFDLTGAQGWICGTGGLAKTTDFGTSWSTVTIPGASVYFAVDFIDQTSGVILFKNGNDYFSAMTSNSGSNWQVSPAIVSLNSNSGDIYIAAPGISYANIEGRLFKTTDSGLNWSEIPVVNANGKFQFINANTGFISGKSSLKDPYEIQRTTDGGATFTPMNVAAFGFTNVNAMYFFNESSGIAALNSSEEINGESTMIKTTNGGSSWEVFHSGAWQGILDVFIRDQDNVWLSGFGGAILNSTNAGFNFNFSISGIIRYADNNQTVSSGYVKALKKGPGGSVITVDSAGIQSNGAYTLVNVPPGDTIDLMAFQDDEVDMFDFVPTYHPSTVDWEEAVHIFPTGNLTGIDISVFRIENDGLNVRRVSGGVFDNDLDNAVLGLNGSILYAKTGNTFRGYNLSSNGGLYSIDSLPNGFYEIFCSRIGYPSQRKFRLLFNNNITELNFYYGVISSVTGETSLPLEYSLNQNYPNPFNPVTKIKFALPKSSFIKLVIYDILGREVVSLVNEQLQAGYYELEWNAENLPSGIYFYSLRTDNFSETKKMVLIK